MARSIDPSRMYKVKIALLQSSSTNDFLQDMYDKDQLNGNGTFAVSINDIIGEERFVGVVPWVSKPATWARGKAQRNREWEIVVGEGEFK